ncbi:MAG: dihydroorotate dehydrogenase (quinone), partial [Deltaproteobacteria bacterium]|nr:dihydroorotate dehydrogenase (quinone) [Deltaproteobacteria bacterium]
HAAELGGLSGRPLHRRALETLATLHRLSGGRLTLVGAGGIFSPEDAYAFIRAGASLVQVYTALVYEGPGLPRRLKSGLAALLTRDGFSTLAQAVGTGTRK